MTLVLPLFLTADLALLVDDKAANFVPPSIELTSIPSGVSSLRARRSRRARSCSTLSASPFPELEYEKAAMASRFQAPGAGRRDGTGGIIAGLMTGRALPVGPAKAPPGQNRVARFARWGRFFGAASERVPKCEAPGLPRAAVLPLSCGASDQQQQLWDASGMAAKVCQGQRHGSRPPLFAAEKAAPY